MGVAPAQCGNSTIIPHCSECVRDTTPRWLRLGAYSAAPLAVLALLWHCRQKCNKVAQEQASSAPASKPRVPLRRPTRLERHRANPKRARRSLPTITMRAILLLAVGAAALKAPKQTALAVRGGGVAAEAARYAASWAGWGVAVRTVFVLHGTWSVNSMAHLFGYRNYETRDESTNNWLVALISHGEGWHNNHHAEPRSAAHGHRWWEYDMSWWIIRSWEMIGLAKNVVRPKCMQPTKSS
mgnify:CR=1 FL=1